MKKTISFLLAIIIIASVCAGLFMLFGRFSFVDAAVYGLCTAIVGALSPIVAAWVEKLFCKSKR